MRYELIKFDLICWSKNPGIIAKLHLRIVKRIQKKSILRNTTEY